MSGSPSKYEIYQENAERAIEEGKKSLSYALEDRAVKRAEVWAYMARTEVLLESK